MNEFIFNAESRDRVLAKLIRFIHQWPADKPCLVRVERFVKSRTNQQNRALWGLAYKVLSEATGYDMEDIHREMCGRFFGWAEHEVFGRVEQRPIRTTTTDERGKRDVLSWERFSEFFDFVQRFAAEELELYIPDPDPDWWAKREAA